GQPSLPSSPAPAASDRSAVASAHSSRSLPQQSQDEAGGRAATWAPGRAAGWAARIRRPGPPLRLQEEATSFPFRKLPLAQRRYSSAQEAASAATAPRAWPRVLSGRRLSLLAPSPLDVELEGTAHGLCRVARCNGHTQGAWPFSVAPHSLLV